MGVIQRQSIKQSLVNYLAALIAAISTVFIYPLDLETYGLARFIIDTSIFLAPFLMIGFNGVSIRFFPKFKASEKGHRGFLFFLILGVLAGCLIGSLLIFLFRDQIYNLYADRPSIYQDYLPFILPTAMVIAFVNLFYSYSTNFKRIAVQAIFQNLIKIVLPLLILLYIWQYISLDQVVQGIFVNFLLVLSGLIIYIYWLGQLNLKPDFTFLSSQNLKAIGNYALFGLFGSIGSVLAFRIDSIMVSTMIDFESNGAFAIAAFIAGVIAIPTNAIVQIAGPIVTQALVEEDYQHIRRLYQKSSTNLLIVGLLIFICIAVSIDDLFAIMPEDKNLSDGTTIVLIIGLAKVIDMGTSINNQIISYSKYYRFAFYAILLMAVFNVLANLILIPKYQVIGAALATLASLSLYNLAKLLFILWRFKMQPFRWNTIYVLMIAGISCLIGLLIPSTEYLFLNILIRSVLVLFLYLSAILYFNISPEVTDLMKNALNRLKNK